MITRERAFSGFILLCVLVILLMASYLRFDQASTQSQSQVRDLSSVSRVVYYRAQPDAGPRFRLSGGEQAIRLITHLAVDRSAAWPVERYRPQTRYPYGLELRLRNPDGTIRWTKIVHVSSSVSKGKPRDGVWTQEAAFSETRTFVPTDARVTQIELPADTSVNSSLQVRLVTPLTSFAMVRAYGLTTKDHQLTWLDNIAMSPTEKRDLVQGITYLGWDEIDGAQQEQRLATNVTRLTAASDIRSDSKIIPLYLSDYRVPRSPKSWSRENAFLPPWNETFVVEGPTRLDLTLNFADQQLLEVESSPHLLHIERSDEQGQVLVDVEPFWPQDHASSRRLHHFIEVPAGQHTFKLRWDPPKPASSGSAELRSRRNKIHVDHAKSHSQKLAYTMHLAANHPLDLSLDSWNHPPPQSEIDPVRWRSDYYYLSQDTGPLHFLVPANHESARMFKIKVTDWDLAPLKTAAKDLSFAFLDGEGRPIDGGDAPISQVFDRDRWVTVQGTLKGDDEPQPLTIGLGEGQSFSGITPRDTRWLALSAKRPLLVQVSSRIPNTTSSTFRRPLPDTPIEQKPRHWIPMLAKEHPRFDQKGWVMSVKSTIKHRAQAYEDEQSESGPKAWKSLLAVGRPVLHRILEESPFEDTGSGVQRGEIAYPDLAALWQDCPHCWMEIPPYQPYRVLDTSEQRTEPQALWATMLQSSLCAFRIDGQEETFVCPVQRERTEVRALAGGAHRFRWQSDGSGDRLWLNRAGVPLYGGEPVQRSRLYVQRTITELDPRGQDYVVSKNKSAPQYLNFRVYRPAHKHAAMPEALALDIELDAGAPGRYSGQLFSHFTPSRKRAWVHPTHSPELIFLDDDASGPFECFEFGFRLGQDIKFGRHRVRIRAQSNERLWVRAFELGTDRRPPSSTFFGQTSAAK